MTSKRLCSIDGCDQPHFARSWCRTHYLRWKRNGDPTVVVRAQAPDGEAARFYQDVILPYKGVECLIWPFARHKSGYPRMWFDGENRHVHRRLCEDVNGPPPNPDDEAAHGCGNGMFGCVTGDHLRWRTSQQNNAEKRMHGTNNRKLTVPEVREIRRLEGQHSQRQIAAMFDVCRATVREIHLRLIWAWLD